MRINNNTKRKKTHKKSQMEMFGLSLIVILIIIGFLLFVSFRKTMPITDYKKSYIADETASNFVNSVVNVNPVECVGNDYTISDMLKFCARGDQIDCGASACEIANKTLWNITSRTLVKQGMTFILYTENAKWGDPAAEIELKNGDCTNRERGQVGTIPISLYPVPGHVYLSLAICN